VGQDRAELRGDADAAEMAVRADLGGDPIEMKPCIVLSSCIYKRRLLRL
jgi:hypothetical protein